MDKRNTSDTTALLKTHIQTLVSEIYFLRSELQEKNVIIKSLIALNSKSNTTSKQVFSESPINTYPNLNNDKNSKSLLNVPGKESSIDFQVKESHVVQPEEEHRVLIPLSDREESDTSVNDKQSKAETVPLSDAIINKNEQRDILAKKEEINKNNDGLEPAEKTSYEKRVFIVGDSIIKNVNGYEVSGKKVIVGFTFDPLLVLKSGVWRTILNQFQGTNLIILFFTLAQTIFRLIRIVKI